MADTNKIKFGIKNYVATKRIGVFALYFTRFAILLFYKFTCKVKQIVVFGTNCQRKTFVCKGQTSKRLKNCIQKDVYTTVFKMVDAFVHFVFSLSRKG